MFSRQPIDRKHRSSRKNGSTPASPVSLPCLNRNRMSNSANISHIRQVRTSLRSELERRRRERPQVRTARSRRHTDVSHQMVQRAFSVPSQNDAKIIHPSPTVSEGLPVNTRSIVGMAMEDLSISNTVSSDDGKMADTARGSFQGQSRSPVSYESMLLETPTNRVTEENLIDSVRATYATLLMAEHQCIDADKIMSEGTKQITREEWKAALDMHQSLLAEFHDFFIVTQHEGASEVVRSLPNTYAMPARLWRYSIHTFLELLRQNLPGSFDFMLEFVYIAYKGIALLLDQLSAFKEVWIECLGDLARYRMAIEDRDMGDRKVWAQVSRSWYNKDANLRPGVGRIQHHLAVLSRPDVLQQLFYYTKSLVSPQRFDNAREGLSIIFSFYEKYSLEEHSLTTAFITTHGILFREDLNEQEDHIKNFTTMANVFLCLLRAGFRRPDRQGIDGVYIMSSNFASMLEYGKQDSIIASEVAQIKHKSAEDAYTYALTCSYNDMVQLPPVPTAFYGSCLSFHTLAVLLDQPGDPNIYPGFHTSLAMIWCLSLQPPLMQHLQYMIPWLAIVRCLNTILSTCRDSLRPIIKDIEARTFPTFSYNTLREDFLIRAQTWSRLYYPKMFFDNAIPEDERPLTEETEAANTRQYRCLWLGIRIASFGQWITYSSNRGFAATKLAHKYASMAETCGGLISKAPLVAS